MTTKDIAYSSLFAGIIAISAMMIIPTPIVPFSLQPLAISLSAIALSKRQSLLAVTTYIVAGLIGLPIFSGGSGGLSVIIKPTFGFILGFIPMTYFIHHFKHLQFKKIRIISFITGFISLYSIGLLILFFNLTLIQNIPISINTLFVSYCFPFLPTDTISFLLASLIYDRYLKKKIG